METIRPALAGLIPVRIRTGTLGFLWFGRGLALRFAGDRVSSAAALARFAAPRRAAALTLRPTPARHPSECVALPLSGLEPELTSAKLLQPSQAPLYLLNARR